MNQRCQMQNCLLPTWIVIWLVVSMLVVFWDVMFVLLRPASFAGGSLAAIWIPYVTYIKIDTSYADMNNAFVKAQAIMSLVEIVISIIALYLNYTQKKSAAMLFAFSALLLTGTKTVLLFLVEATGGFKYVGHNSMAELILYYYLPNAVWIIVPYLAVFNLGYILVSRLDQTEMSFDFDKID